MGNNIKNAEVAIMEITYDPKAQDKFPPKGTMSVVLHDAKSVAQIPPEQKVEIEVKVNEIDQNQSKDNDDDQR